MPPSPLGPGEKLTCISYAPFHGDQAPFTWNLRIPDRQIAADLRRLSALTSCVRTYSAKGAQGRIAELAPAFGLDVLQGIWLGRDRADNRREIEAALELARKHPATIKALIVGNETLLRGELPADEIKARLKEVRERSGLPVTYADVWEFWLKAPELAAATDFVTIHILPYWEDDPVAERDAVAHVREVRRKVRGRVPRQGDLDRRGGLAEPGPDARRRSAVAGQPGALLERRGFARQGRELEGEPDRGLRSAVEAPARRHRGRLLGSLRRRAACAEIPIWRAGVEPSGLATQGGPRRRRGPARLYRFLGRLSRGAIP